MPPSVVNVGASMRLKWGWCCPMPKIATGFLGKSRARSALVTSTAPPPSDSSEQSSKRNGAQIMREFWWSWSVIGLRMVAFLFKLACLRVEIAISARSSLVVPNSYIWRDAANAWPPAAAKWPQGSSQCSSPRRIG